MYNEPSEKELLSIPKLYSTENVPLKEKIIYLHFFLSNSDWFIAEYDGDDIFFGFVCLNGWIDLAEWGNISLKELKELKIKPSIKINEKYFSMPLEVDRDLCFKPKKAYEIPLICKCQKWY
jgi:hypothetical protein